MERQYIAIDLKSFFASVECAKRNLDALKTNLVVADASRTEKTVCLAVTPSLKAYGIGGRARLFEVVQKVKEINQKRRAFINGRPFKGKSFNSDELAKNPYLELDFIIAPPCMGDYIKKSTEIYSIYLKYIAKEDIHVYSIDEVFMDVTSYLGTYKQTPRELAMTMIKDVLSQTKITATAGIGPNLYLCKIAMDVMAKKIDPDENGVRIAELDEITYRKMLWSHKPITDFWRVGKGIANRLASRGIYTMGDIARVSVKNEEVLYSLFGINAELLIDHAWGWEPVGIKEIKEYKPQSNSISSGQVLSTPYPFEKARICAREMADLVALELVARKTVTDQLGLFVVYDIENLSKPGIGSSYSGPVVLDYYGRPSPKPAHGTINLNCSTSASSILMQKTDELFTRIVNPDLLVRRIYISANHTEEKDLQQPDLFSDFGKMEKETNLQETALQLKKKYGKNAILKGLNLEEGATTIIRNKQIGGHKA